MKQPDKSEIPVELFKLSKIADNPLFEGFALKTSPPSILGNDSLDDDMCPGWGVSSSTHRWTQVRLRDKWKPPEVIGRVAPFNDFPSIDLVLPAFSQRACDALRDLLEPNGELLPLRSNVGEPYYFYNITTISDALDLDKSVCEDYPESPSGIGDIDHFEFHPKRLMGKTIFRIHEWPIATIVSNRFVQRVRECGLNGFDFVKIWPLPRDVDWRTAVHHERQPGIVGEDLKQNTMVIIFPLQGRQPNSKEKRAIKKLEDELDAQLAMSSIDAPFFGWYEGSDTGVDGEFRMFLSCEKAETLELKLLPWLRHISWPAPIRAVKRYGRMHDAEARESEVTLV